MRRGIRGRAILLAFSLVASVVYFLPSTPFYAEMPGIWQGLCRVAGCHKGISLGLDLRGGTHLVLEVEQEKALDNQLGRAATGIRDAAADRGVAIEAVRVVNREVVIRYQGEEARDAILKLMDQQATTLGLRDSRESELVYQLRTGEAQQAGESIMSQALETIRNRIDQFGVAEPLIQRQGLNQIVIQLPGVKDPQRAVDLIGKTALLEFKLVDDDSSLEKAQREGVPEGDISLYERAVNRETGQATKVPYLVKDRTLLSGDTISDARVSIGQFNDAYVTVRFDSVGARLFDRITGEYVKKRLAIILDGTVYSAPVIQERIANGNAQITGRFTMQEATDLAIVLKAGALPAPVKIIQNLTVGPSLGQDSIHAGIRATMFAGLAVILFMVFYYRLSGLIADVALLFNLIILVGALAALNATLTLPGIAGIILTIGMGVDSNVLILERIREELKQQRPVRMAVDAGYDKALVTIIDSHITTLITALALFMLGTGPIKGFAVTLSLGIAINLFTALVGTKVVYDYINSRWRLARLSI